MRINDACIFAYPENLTTTDRCPGPEHCPHLSDISDEDIARIRTSELPQYADYAKNNKIPACAWEEWDLLEGK